jgi:hypothetical protein
MLSRFVSVINYGRGHVVAESMQATRSPVHMADRAFLLNYAKSDYIWEK